MSKVAVEHVFQGPTAPIAAYDSTKTCLGSLIQQRAGVTGASNTDFFAGPMPIGMARPMESNISVAMFYPHVITYDTNTDAVFLIENVATSRILNRIFYYKYNRLNSTFMWQGAISWNFPGTAATYTCAAFRAIRDTYTTGTAYCGGTGPGIDGAGTQWLTDRIAGGARIGFGTTDPTQISSWYYLQPTGPAPGDTSWTLTQTGPNTSVTGPYIIEELRFLYLARVATLQGGLYFLKGLNLDSFGPTGPNPFMGIATGPTGPSGDNRRAVYWLKDAAATSLQGGIGIGLIDRTDWQTHDCYVLNNPFGTYVDIYKYNLRAALSPGTGFVGTTGPGNTDIGQSFQFKTGQVGLIGAISATNCARYVIASHGPGSGLPSIYFVTATRIYRSQLSDIYKDSIRFISEVQPKFPRGAASTFPATAALSSIDYADMIDRFFVMSAGSTRSYCTKYYGSDSIPFDQIFLCDAKQLDQSLADSSVTSFPSLNATAMSIWTSNGLLYICRNGTTVALNQIYVIPEGADWAYASTTGQRLITPAINTPNATKFYRAYINSVNLLGGAILGQRPEAFRVYARTSGISDNSGSWLLLDQTGDLSFMTPSSQVQLMFEFRVLSPMCIPARILSCCVLYEDSSTDSHYQPSVAFSSASSKRFAWRLATAFGSPIPSLRVRFYDAITGGLLLDDDTGSSTGTFEQSTNGGGSWEAWTNSDKGNETTYLRYTPASFPSNIKARALLTLL